MAVVTGSSWRQIDAGIWRKSTDWGHWEISFSSDTDGHATFELVALDERSATLVPPDRNPIFDSLVTACSFADANSPIEALRAA